MPRRPIDPPAVPGLFESFKVDFAVTDSSNEATTITVRAADDGVEPRTIALGARVLGAAVSGDGNRVATTVAVGSTRGGYERRPDVRSVATNAPIATRQFDPVLDPGMAACLHFAGDDRYLVVGTRAGVEIVVAERLTSNRDSLSSGRHAHGSAKRGQARGHDR